jgi:Cytochrome oxidase complex assembly protein 1
LATPPYPLSYSPATKSWLDRNAGWKILLGCVLLIAVIVAFCAILFAVIQAFFHNSVVYQEALARAERSPQVASRIGVPLRPGRVLEGRINVSGSNGTARMAIPVTGSRGKATIYLDARKASGAWQFLTLQIQFEGQPDCLNLLPESGGASVSCSP